MQLKYSYDINWKSALKRTFPASVLVRYVINKLTLGTSILT